MVQRPSQQKDKRYKEEIRDTWLAQSVKPVTLDLGIGGLSPTRRVEKLKKKKDMNGKILNEKYNN